MLDPRASFGIKIWIGDVRHTVGVCVVFLLPTCSSHILHASQHLSNDRCFLFLLFIYIYSFKGLENHAEILAGNTVYARPSRASTACATNSFPTCWQAGFVANPLPWFFLFFFLDCAPLACPPACMRVCVRVNVCSETSVCAMTGKPATDREGEGVGGRQLTDVFFFVPSSGLDSRTLGPYILKLQYRKMRSPDNH